MRAPLSLALEALRLERRLVLLLLAAVTLTAALVFPTEALPRLGLQLDPIAPAIGGLPLTDAATGPSDAQRRSLVELLELLRALGWAALAVAALTVLALYAVSSARRSHELGVHRAVGASRRTMLATLLLEALAVAVVALVLGAVAGRVVLARALADWPGLATRHGAWPLGAASILVALVAIGRLIPVHVAARRDVPLDGPRPVSLGVPIVQFGVSLSLLLAGGALFAASAPRPNAGAGTVAPTARGAVVEIDARALDAPARAQLFGALLDDLQADGIALPSLASDGQAIGLGTVDFLTTHCGMCLRGGVYLEFEATHAVHHLVSPDSFAAHRIPVLSGRGFARTDTLGAERVVVVNRQMALRHFQAGDPVGRHLYLADGFPGIPYTVIGVVDDGVPEAFGAAHQRGEHVYLSVLQHPPERAQLLVRAEVGTRARALTHLAGVVTASGGSAGTVRDEAGLRARAVAPARWLGRWALAAGGVLVLLSALGLASTMQSWVASLQAELGLRRALGATRRSVLWHVGWRAMLAGVVGAGVSLVVTWTVVQPVVAASLRGVPLWQPRAFALSTLALLLVSVASALLPTHRLVRAAPARLFD